GSLAPAFLIITGDPCLVARLQISLPNPCHIRIRPLQAPTAAAAIVLHRAAVLLQLLELKANTDKRFIKHCVKKTRLGPFGGPCCASIDRPNPPCMLLLLSRKGMWKVYYILIILLMLCLIKTWC
ncbi:hypothetical protein ZWY2020_020900, partial [Hordeum vulgare]